MYDLSGPPPPPPSPSSLLQPTSLLQPYSFNLNVKTTESLFILETLLIGPPCYSTRILLPSVGKFIGFCCITMKTIKC